MRVPRRYFALLMRSLCFTDALLLLYLSFTYALQVLAARVPRALLRRVAYGLLAGAQRFCAARVP
jgi:hypothetical protein